MKKTIICMLFMMSSAFAGNGSSGGGSIFADQVNPWFLQNTPTVRYCIKTSPDFSSIDPVTLQIMIDSAFEFWKKEFKKVKTGHQFITPQVQIATQDFYHTKCDDKVDLVFQLGVISEEQKKLISNFPSVIGIAFRESYDEVNLKGRGFIYIAPEKGPLRPVSDNFALAPWSETREDEHEKLKVTLLHEIGHIFGLQDEFQGDDNSDLMSASMVETASSKDTFSVGTLAPFSPLMRSASYHFISTTHIFSQNVKDFLGVPDNGSVAIRGYGDRIALENSSSPDHLDFIGTIRIDNRWQNLRHQAYSTKIRLWLPANQKVFTVNWTPHAVRITYFDILRTLSSFTLINQEYRRKDGLKQKVDLYFGDWSGFTIGALVDGVYHHDLIHEYSETKRK